MSLLNGNSRSRSRFSMRGIYIQAVVVAILFHLALGLLFAVPESVPITVPPQQNTVTMLPLYGDGTGHDQEITDALLYGDPTKIAKPDDRVGYGLLVREKPVKAISELELSYQAPVSNALKSPEFERVVADAPSTLYTSLRSNLPNINGLPHRPFAVPAPKGKDEYPVWLNQSGVQIKQLFTDLASVKKTVAKMKPKSHTVLRVYSDDLSLLPRVKVEVSSGVLALDMEAVRAMQLAGEIRDKCRRNHDFCRVVVQWARQEPLP